MCQIIQPRSSPTITSPIPEADMENASAEQFDDGGHTGTDYDPSDDPNAFADSEGNGELDVHVLNLLRQQYIDNFHSSEQERYHHYFNLINPRRHSEICDAPNDNINECNNTTSEHESSSTESNTSTPENSDTQIQQPDWSKVNDKSKRVMYHDMLAFQTHLLSVISSFRRVPLALFDRIMEVFFVWVINGNLDFNSRYFHASRASLLNELKTIHNMKGVKSKLASVRMQNGSSSAGVVLFDFVGIINHMFQDSRIFCKENIAAGYCIWSGKAEDCGVYGEIHTGTKWKEAVEHYIGDDPNRFPLSLISFIDETHTDLKEGNLTVSPVMIQISWLNFETRKKTYSMFPIGFIPNLSFGKSKKDKNTVNGLKDEHNCLFAIFESLIDISKSESRGFNMTVLGRSVTAVPWIHFIIGDIKGNNRLFAAFNNNQGLTKRPHRMCKCDDLSSIPEQIANGSPFQKSRR